MGTAIRGRLLLIIVVLAQGYQVDHVSVQDLFIDIQAVQ